MSHAMIIASRELRERSRVFLIAIAMAVVPFAAVLLPGARSDRNTSIAMVAAFLSFAFAFGLALAFGASTIGRELAEKRLSFLFSKPFAPASIWIGKAAAALITSLACFFIIALPSLPASRAAFGASADALILLAVAGIIVLFLVSHAMATMVRSRSLLIGIDFVCAAAAVAAVVSIVRPIVFGGALEAVAWILGAIVVAVVLILAAAPVWQLAKGRTDVRRSHAALSRALWIPLAIVLAVAGAYGAWFLAVAPDDITTIGTLTQSPSSDVVLLAGAARGRGDYHPTLLFSPSTGRYDRLPSPPWWGVEMSRDGRTLAWMQPTGITSDTFELYTRKLDVDAKNVATGVRTGGIASIVLSADGSRVALANGEAVSIYDVASGKLVASAARLDGRAGHQLFFVSNDVLRIYEYSRERNAETVPLAIYEVQIATKSMTKTGERVVKAGHAPVSVSGDGATMLIRRDGVIADARSAATIAVVPAPANATFASAMLRDGRVAAVARENGAHLCVYTKTGALAYDVALPAVQNAWISGETTDGKLVLIGFNGGQPQPGGKGRTMFLVDGANGTIARSARDVKGPMPQFSADPRLVAFRAGTKLVGVDAAGKVTTW